MHWLMKAILSILSLAFIFSCKENTERSEPKKTVNADLVDSLVQLSLNWNDSTLIQIDQVGRGIRAPLIFYSSEKTKNVEGFSISSEDRGAIEKLIKLNDVPKNSCSEFNDYKVCLKELPDGSQLRFSIKPHPTRKWVFSLERIN